MWLNNIFNYFLNLFSSKDEYVDYSDHPKSGHHNKQKTGLFSIMYSNGLTIRLVDTFNVSVVFWAMSQERMAVTGFKMVISGD